jgi:phosphatidylglycerol:prolipoprotein diacylglycerol transferase
MIDFTPNPIAWSFGSLEIRWYGIAYIAAILIALLVLTREARRRGERTDIIVDGLIAISAAALIGGRAYHVIDQWGRYSQHPADIFLPPYSGLGVYGGIFTGLLVAIYLSRRWRVSLWRWGDMIVLAMLAAQTVGRWGNFMNQELYGPPTDLPWGIAIQCDYRVAEYACPAMGGTTPVDAHFHPLFLYESLLSLLGFFVLLWLWNHFTARRRYLIAGDVGLLYFVWYGLERSLLESLRGGWNWTFNGIAVAQIVGLGGAATAIAVLFVRHWWVRGHPPAGEPSEPSEPAAAAPGAA